MDVQCEDFDRTLLESPVSSDSQQDVQWQQCDVSEQQQQQQQQQQDEFITDHRNLAVRSAASSDELDSRATRNSHRDVSGHVRRQQQQQQREGLVISDSKTSSGDRRSTAVQRLVDLQHQSKHLSRLLAAKKQDFEMKMENLQQRREQLHSAELRFKQLILDNDKSILDNEARRTRALKKAKDSQEMCKIRDKEIERVRSELSELEQHRARLSDKLSKQSIFEEFLTQVMSSSSEFIDIRSIISRYHTLKQLYEDLNEKQLKNEELLKDQKNLLYEMKENNTTRVLRHNTILAEMQSRLDRAHSRVVDAESALVRLDAELATKTIMFGNIVTVTTNIYRMVESSSKKSLRPLRGKKTTDPIQQLATIHQFLSNFQELLKGVEELGYRRRTIHKTSTTTSLI